jgi:6-carboxyhexanoate--CoA ligase
MDRSAASRYYSVRMHASRHGRHVSGAEDLVGPGLVATTTGRFVDRALAAGELDELVVRVEPVTTIPAAVPLLPLFTVAVEPIEAAGAAITLLTSAGVAAHAARSAMAVLAAGAAGGGCNMRGAMLVDATSGARLEDDPARGVRASRFGLDPVLHEALGVQLAAAGYPHPRTLEAWILASKMVAAPGAVAELCWSDDPSYTTGYVALAAGGYVRIPHLKSAGNPRGGRALFLSTGIDTVRVVSWLESVPCLVGGTVVIQPPRPLQEVVEAVQR